MFVPGGTAALTLVGVSFGLAGAAAGGQFIEALLAEAGATALPVMLVSAGLLGVVALAAAAGPALRAAEVSPNEAIRRE